MKRDLNLVPLSREHHFGLLFCWKIKQGIAKKVSLDMLRDYALYYWKQHLQEHFAKEEEVLLPMLSLHDPKRRQLEEEHQQIRQIITELEQGPLQTKLPLASLQALLSVHIRFEERELFPYLENIATTRQLEQIGELLQEHEALPEDDFHPHFWVY